MMLKSSWIDACGSGGVRKEGRSGYRNESVGPWKFPFANSQHRFEKGIDMYDVSQRYAIGQSEYLCRICRYSRKTPCAVRAFPISVIATTARARQQTAIV